MIPKDLAREGPWADRLEPILRPTPVAEPETYYGLLAPHAEQLEVWETIYHQVLEGENPVVEFTKGTALRPVLEALGPATQTQFLELYTERMAAAYPLTGVGSGHFPVALGTEFRPPEFGDQNLPALRAHRGLEPHFRAKLDSA